MAQALDVVIMAAGKGTRMKSAHPKVLHKLAGQALLVHAWQSAIALGARQVVMVTGHGRERVQSELVAYARAHGLPLPDFAVQEPQLGTGHALQQAMPHLSADDGVVVVLSGDVPLTQPDTLAQLVQLSAGERLALLTLDFDDPSGYGRVVRAGKGVQRIVEHKDADEVERAIKECYGGIMAVPARWLKQWLPRLTANNAQREYYLTQVVALAVADGVAVSAHKISDALQVAGVNSPAQLAQLERAHQERTAQALLEQGVRLADPARLDVRGRLVCDSDVEIDVGCVFEGDVSLGAGVKVGAYCVIANARIAQGTVILPFTHIDGEASGVEVGHDARIGPFARLRPGARLAEQVHVGNFVEIKNTTMGVGAKANHLAYLGDAQVGARVNYGAGSITANYDGANKHYTVIEPDVHVGSNCVLVAPLTVGAGGTVGAGSVVTKDTAAGALTVSRARQTSIAAWQRPQKKKA